MDRQSASSCDNSMRQEELRTVLDTANEHQRTEVLDVLHEITTMAKETVICAQLIKTLCGKLKLMKWKSVGGEKDSEVLEALCKTIAVASMYSDTRRLVRNEGGLKPLVELLNPDFSDSVIEAAAHAVMNLMVDNINKDALRVCGYFDQTKRLFVEASNAQKSKYVLGSLLNSLANNLVNVLVMVDSGFVPMLEKLLLEGINDQTALSRAQLLLATLYFHVVPFPSGKESKDSSEERCLYDILKQENTDDGEVLNSAFNRWAASQEAHVEMFKMGLVGDAAVILKQKLKSKTVIVGILGVDTSGVQFLYALAQSKGLECVSCGVGTDRRAALQLDTAKSLLPPVLLFNDDEASYFLINLSLAPEECIGFVSNCFDFMSNHYDGDFLGEGQLIILSSLRIKQKIDSEGPLYVCLNDSKNEDMSEFNVFPKSYPIADALISTWFHFARTLEVKTTGILLPGYSPPPDQDLPADNKSNIKYAAALKKFISVPNLPELEFKSNGFMNTQIQSNVLYI